MKSLLKVIIMASVFTGVMHPAFAISLGKCTPATQSYTCVCFPNPIGCIDSTDPGNRP